ncbi:MAG: hypothetical protein WA399_14940 [Acidobacteriaceae bacterium]
MSTKSLGSIGIKTCCGLVGLLGIALCSAHAQAPSFIQPSTEYTTTMAGAPSMATLGDQIFIAFRSNDPSNSLWLKASTVGGSPLTWPNPAANFLQYSNMASDPKLGANSSYLFVTYALSSPTGEPQVLWTPNGGETWYSNPALGIVGGYCGFVTFNSQELLLCPYYNGSSQLLNVFTFNGSQFVKTATATIPDLIASAPSAVEWNGDIYFAFETPGGNLGIGASSDGVNFGATVYTTTMASPPTMSVFNNLLQVAFQAQADNNYLFVKTSDVYGTFGNPATGYTIQIGNTPALGLYGGYLYLGFEAANGTHRLFTTYATH